MKIRPDLAGLGVAALVGVLLVACSIAHVDAPSFLAELGLVALGIGGGAALPSRAAAVPAPDPSPAARAETSRVSLDSTGAVRYGSTVIGHYDEPSTGIFARVVEP